MKVKSTIRYLEENGLGRMLQEGDLYYMNIKPQFVGQAH